MESSTDLVLISPQPITDEAIISFISQETNSVTIELYDIKGSLHDTYTFSDISCGVNKLRINMSGYQSGIYYIVLRIGENTYHTKIVKAE